MTRLAAIGVLLLAGAPAFAHPPQSRDDPARHEARESDAHRDTRERPWSGRHHTLVDIPVPDGVRVPAWTELSPERQQRLARLKPTWDSLPASRRVRALERLERQRRWDALAPEERERLREGARNFHDLPPELKDRMRASMRAMRALPDEERRRLFERWRALDPDKRREWLEAGGPGLSPQPPGD